MEYRKSGRWEGLLSSWRQPEEPKVYAFLSRIFREWWEEDEVRCGSTMENVRPMDFPYVTEGLLQKLDLEHKQNENKGKNMGKKQWDRDLKAAAVKGQGSLLLELHMNAVSFAVSARTAQLFFMVLTPILLMRQHFNITRCNPDGTY